MTRVQYALIHEPYALPIALARSYESFVLSRMENPSDCWVNNADWASSCVGLMPQSMVRQKGKQSVVTACKLCEVLSEKGRLRREAFSV